MLDAKQLTKQYGSHVALDRLDLSIQAGESVCLCGPNGAGKTTTIRLFLGLTKPSSGTVRIGHVRPDREPTAARRACTFVPESVRLYPYLSGEENLAYLLSLSSPEIPSRSKLRDYLSDVGLSAAEAARRADGYSKGMRQKVVLALALARQTRALLLDEPTSGLDPSATRELIALLESAQGRGAAVLTVSHDLEFVRRIAGRIGLMAEGRLRALLKEPPDDLAGLYFEHLIAPSGGGADDPLAPGATP